MKDSYGTYDGRKPEPPYDDDLPGMLAVAKGVAEQKWPHTMDAAVWAAEFCKRYPGSEFSEGDMIGWFANAIMAGYDTANAQRAEAAAINLPAVIGPVTPMVAEIAEGLDLEGTECIAEVVAGVLNATRAYFDRQRGGPEEKSS